MAITASDIATPLAGSGTASLTTVVTLTGSAAIGDVVLVFHNCALGAASADSFSATDSKGNSYTQEAIGFVGSNEQVVVLMTRVTTALAAADTITITNGTASRAKRSVIVKKLTGAVNAQDLTPVADSSNTAASTITNGPTTLNNDLTVSAWSINNSAGVCSMGGWDFEQVVSTVGTADKRLCVGLIDAGLSGSSVTATLTPTTTAQPWCGVVLFIKAVVLGSPMVFVKTVTVG